MSTITLKLNLKNPKSVRRVIRFMEAALGDLAEISEDSAPTATPVVEAKKPISAPVAAPTPAEPLPLPPAVTAMEPAPPAPIPAPTVTEPVATIPAPAPIASAPVSATLDSEGLPWDERIHQGTRGRMSVKGVKDAGAWKIKKQPATYATKELWLEYVAGVKAELHQAMASAPAPEPVPLVASTPPTPAMPTASPAAPAPLAPAPAPMAPLPTPSAPPAMSATAPAPSVTEAPATGHTFATLLGACTAAGIFPAQIAEAAAEASGGAVTSVPLLAARADLIPAIAAALGV